MTATDEQIDALARHYAKEYGHDWASLSPERQEHYLGTATSFSKSLDILRPLASPPCGAISGDGGPCVLPRGHADRHDDGALLWEREPGPPRPRHPEFPVPYGPGSRREAPRPPTAAGDGTAFDFREGAGRCAPEAPAEALAAAPVPCKLPPPGWTYSRGAEHPVPCAAHRAKRALALLTEALDESDEELPTEAEGAEAVARLGIDIPTWAAEIRQRVDDAHAAEVGRLRARLVALDEDPCPNCEQLAAASLDKAAERDSARQEVERLRADLKHLQLDRNEHWRERDKLTAERDAARADAERLQEERDEAVVEGERHRHQRDLADNRCEAARAELASANDHAARGWSAAGAANAALLAARAELARLREEKP